MFSPEINCVYHIFGTRQCSNKNIKRKWFGFGQRLCVLADPKDCRICCPFIKRRTSPPEPPPKLPPLDKIFDNLRKRINREDFSSWYYEKYLKKTSLLPPEPPKPPPSRDIGIDLSKFFKKK